MRKHRTTRLAPSPTGALHLGNARTFLITWALARKNGWRVVLRVEDLDGPRVKAGAAAGIVDTLAWLGMDWDGEVVVQSSNLTPYVEAMRGLARKGLVYPSALSRADVLEAASAPHAGGEVRFDASLRPPGWDVPREFEAGEAGSAAVAWRFATPGTRVTIDDAFAGVREFVPSETIGDFIVWTKQGVPAYQLAVVVDDARQGVTDVVRGDDLLESAARQVLLMRALYGEAFEPPRYWHVPLVLGSDGRRLAKRHGDTRVDTYRAAGVRRERVIGLIAWWCGVTGERREMGPVELMEGLAIERVPKDAVTFTPEDDRWLRGLA